MSLLNARSALTRRIAVTAAAGALAAAVAVTPAAADDHRGGGDPGSGAVADRPAGGDGGDAAGQDGRPQGDYLGRVTAERLALRTSPSRGSEVVRYARRGEIVHIYCKTPGDTVQGNPRWYLLADGTWAWGSARYIANIGPAPRWC
ncbi:SH3 domain-containing protein [Streptomyces sp. JHA26]|uniref:SH3 domain-containing protein n=1 Tax=Streptomyces sp. JHA26 TaxID=1917143 RepID=UPI00098B5665|nr:SH3 domain-containing protein [Streptomyces sp. JHA26]